MCLLKYTHMSITHVCVFELMERLPHIFFLSVVSQLGGESAHGEPLFEQQ